MSKLIIRNFVDRSTGCNQVPRPGKHHPTEGEVDFKNGLRFVYRGGYWDLDQIIDPIDQHHNYSGHQDPKRPYNGVKSSHISCGAKLFR